MQFSTLIKCLLVASVTDRVSATLIYSSDLIAQHLGVQFNDVTELMNATDFGSINATAPETAGATIPPIVLAFIGCAAPFVETGLGAAAGCIKVHQ